MATPRSPSADRRVTKPLPDNARNARPGEQAADVLQGHRDTAGSRGRQVHHVGTAGQVAAF
eukprot:1809059-Pyramimonas_sp.AAC.1